MSDDAAMKSMAVMVPEPGKVLLQEQALDAPRQGEVLIETHYSTLSPGTERHIILGQGWPLPLSIGYSLTGKVIAVGPRVDRFKVDDLVAAVARHASHVAVDQRAVVPIPQGVDLEQAAFFNLAHTALYGIRQAGLQLGEAVAVIGQGIVGLISARLAQIAGGLPVIAIDIDEHRLEISRSLGIQEVCNSGDTARLRRILQQLPGGGVPVVIEVTGLRAPVELALEVVSVRGRIVLLGTTHGSETVNFHQALSMKGARLVGGYVNSKPWSLSQTDMEISNWPPSLAPGERPYAGPGIWTSSDDVRVILDLIKYGSLDLRPLITHRFKPEQVSSAYRQVLDQDRSLVGGVIHWRN
jgi:2-desacetyl-2-hydroxyethyl bacteriochlorophyllide A dehydrogenase